MSKSKEGRPEEFFKSQIRTLKKENNQLRKKVQQLQNQLGPKEERIAKEPKRKENLCPNCDRGTLEELEFVGRVFEVCNVCSYRSKVKKAFKRKK